MRDRPHFSQKTRDMGQPSPSLVLLRGHYPIDEDEEKHQAEEARGTNHRRFSSGLGVRWNEIFGTRTRRSPRSERARQWSLKRSLRFSAYVRGGPHLVPSNLRQKEKRGCPIFSRFLREVGPGQPTESMCRGMVLVLRSPVRVSKRQPITKVIQPLPPCFVLFSFGTAASSLY